MGTKVEMIAKISEEGLEAGTDRGCWKITIPDRFIVDGQDIYVSPTTFDEICDENNRIVEEK